MLGFLCSNLCHCPSSGKRNAYLTLGLVRPLIKNGSVVWDPYFKKDVDMVERI